MNSIFKTILASLLCIAFSGCQSGSTSTGRSGKWEQNPEFIKQRDKLCALLEGSKVTGKWAVASRVVSNERLLGNTNATHVDANVVATSVSYSNCKIGPDGVLSFKAAFTEGESAVSIPLRRVERVFVHNRQLSEEAEKAMHEDIEKNMGVSTPVSYNALSENINKTWAVEIVLGGKRKADDKYTTIHFANKQKAEAFVSTWNGLTAAMR